MSRQWAAYSLVDGYKPLVGDQFHFHYDPTRPALPVEVIFPKGRRELTQDQLAEIGILFLALAGKDNTPLVRELLEGFELQPPPHLEPPPTARQVSREIMANFIATFADVARQYRDNDVARIEVEETMARSLARLFRRA